MMFDPEIVHATTVAIEGKGVLIVGPSGSGKSSLALQLIGMGAALVADDRTIVTREAQRLLATVPETIAGLIEARGVGLLRSLSAGPTHLKLVVDLSQTEADRLPQKHTYTLSGIELPCLYNAPSSHFAVAIWLYVQSTLDKSV